MIAYLDVDLVAAQYNGNVLTHPLEVTMPIWDILVGDAGRDVEHDDAALTLNVVAIAETTELFLTSGIPHIEADGAVVG